MTDAMKARKLSAEAVGAMRHLQVHGACTAGELMKGGHARTTLNSLTACGYVCSDRTQRDVRMVLTNKARTVLANPIELRAPHPRRIASRKEEEALRAKALADSWLSPSLRAGAMVAFTLPSRWNDRLRYPDGRVTDLAGNPITPTGDFQ